MTTTIHATVEARPDATDEVEAALRRMIAPTRAEAGCIRYELFRAEDKPCTFHLLETYADDEALARHHQSAHFVELVASLADRLAQEIRIDRLVALGN